MANISTNNPTPISLVGAELVSVFSGHNRFYGISVHRLKVPGGWLLIASCMEPLATGVGAGLATTFVPDPSGNWDTDSSEEVPNGRH